MSQQINELEAPKYILIFCDCDVTRNCPQGKTASQTRCKIWVKNDTDWYEKCKEGITESYHVERSGIKTSYKLGEIADNVVEVAKKKMTTTKIAPSELMETFIALQDYNLKVLKQLADKINNK